MSYKSSLDKEFLLGNLVTEVPHPKTMNLSQTTIQSPEEGVRMVLGIDNEITAMFRPLEESGVTERLVKDIVDTVSAGNRVFFTGCGATGRLAILLDSMWKKAWYNVAIEQPDKKALAETVAESFYSIMSGGDFALIKSVEGYEDFTAFGKQQLREAGITESDLVVAVTEGGETSFVIGTVLEAVEIGATSYFVYNNPDDVLIGLERCRLMLEDDRITKICLASGPMVITGSTRMQATTSEYAALGFIIEKAFSALCQVNNVSCVDLDKLSITDEFQSIVETLADEHNVEALTKLLQFETETYRQGGKITYFADYYAIDIFTDTTERSPTFCLPPFIASDDCESVPSWAYAVTPYDDNQVAWKRLLGRGFHDITWSHEKIRGILDDSPEFDYSTFPCLNQNEILKFDISRQMLKQRLCSEKDRVILCISGHEASNKVFMNHCLDVLDEAENVSGKVGAFLLGTADEISEIKNMLSAKCKSITYFELVLPKRILPMNTTTHLAVKISLNCISTLTMCLMERVYGNVMIWVMPSNKKLIDRSSRYVAELTGVDYPRCVDCIVGVMDLIQERNKAGAQVYAPVLIAALCLVRDYTPLQAENCLRQAWDEQGTYKDIFAEITAYKQNNNSI
jgi:N-acetylmuramic acid 6-phosphate etherase